jgi:hypothetical protein
VSIVQVEKHLGINLTGVILPVDQFQATDIPCCNCIIPVCLQDNITSIVVLIYRRIPKILLSP